MRMFGSRENEKGQSDSHHKNGGTDRVIGKLCARHSPSRTPGSVASLPDMIARWTVRISLPPRGRVVDRSHLAEEGRGGGCQRQIGVRAMRLGGRTDQARSYSRRLGTTRSGRVPKVSLSAAAGSTMYSSEKL